MTIIKIDPWEKEVKLGKIEPLDDNDENTIEDLIKNSENVVSVEEDLKIITYPMFNERKKFFYYITQKGNIVKIFTFKGIGIVIGNVSKERVEEIKDNIVWH
jgi:hypothetical protein